MEGHPRTLKEIASQTAAVKKDIGSSAKYITKVLGIQVEMAKSNIKAGDFLVKPSDKQLYQRCFVSDPFLLALGVA